MSRQQLLEAAAVMRSEAERLRVHAASLDAQAAMLDAAAKTGPLTIGAKRSMVGSNMEASSLAGKPENVRTSANRARRSSPARDAMIASNHVAGDLAKVCKVGRSTMNAYLNGTRAAPPEVRAKLAVAPWNIPPLSWPKFA